MKNWLIKTKLIIIFAIILSATFILDFIFYRTLTKTTQTKDFTQHFYKFNVTFYEFVGTEKEFLINYRQDPVFFRTEQSTLIRKQDLIYNSLKKQLENFNTLNRSSNFIKFTLTNQIKNYLDNIYSNFKSITHKLYLRGNLSTQTGTVGRIYKDFMLAFQLLPNQNLYQTLNNSYLDYLQYLSSLNTSYFDKFLDDINNLNNQLNTIAYTDTLINHTQIGKFQNLVNEIQSSFQSLITLDKELGFSSTYSGLLGNWEQNIKSAENSILNERANLMKQVQNSFKTTYTTFIIIFVALILVSILLFIILQRLLTDRFRKIYEYITPLKWGEIPEEIEIKHKDEVGYLLEILNSYIKALQETAKFAQELGKGNFDYDFKPISDRDVLGNALLQLREDLKKAQEEEERRKEEERIRQWTNEGISKFAEILRQKSETIEDLARTAIKNLVNYLNANQGAFFYLNDDDPNDVYLELIATYAYSRERKKKKRFKLGEGLVGTVALEKETVYMTDIPEDYISITSGLGEANPRSLLIVPLKAEEEILGVIEIASFNEMKDYEIKFVEQIAESIAATVSITKINQRTAKLLQQSQIQAREMAAQEEEMRQNLEELKATQEEAARREAELRSLLNAIETATFVTVLDLNGFITGANDRLLERLGLTHDQYIGRHISEFDIEGTTATEEFWEKVRSGKAVHYQRHFKVNDKEFWFDEYYAAILGQEGQIQRFLAISYDITQRILQQKELEAQAQQLKEKEAKLRDQMEELEKTRKVLMKEKEHEEKLAKRLQANERILREALADIQRKSKETESFARKLAQEKAELADKYENYQSAKELINYLYKKLNKSAETEKSLIQEKDSIIEQQKQQIEQLKQEIQRLKQNNKSQPPSNNNNDSSQSSDN